VSVCECVWVGSTRDLPRQISSHHAIACRPLMEISRDEEVERWRSRSPPHEIEGGGCAAAEAGADSDVAPLPAGCGAERDETDDRTLLLTLM